MAEAPEADTGGSSTQGETGADNGEPTPPTPITHVPSDAPEPEAANDYGSSEPPPRHRHPVNDDGHVWVSQFYCLNGENFVD